MVFCTQDYLASGLCPLSGIPSRTQLSEIVSLSVFRCIGGEKYSKLCTAAALLSVTLGSGENPENM
jgi:hypothetical protein